MCKLDIQVIVKRLYQNFLPQSVPTAMSAGTLKGNVMKTTNSNADNTTSNIDQMFGSVILPKTQKGRARLFSRTFASMRRNQNAMKRKEEQKAKEAKAAERAAAKETKAKDAAAAKEAKAAERATAKAAKEAQLLDQKEEKKKQNVASHRAADLAIEKGDTIALQEAEYHELYVKKANDDLYKLLQIIMAFVEEILASPHEETIVSSMRFKLKHTYNIGTQSNTSTANVAVRFVTRTSKKNSSVYARVINKAIADGIKSKDLIEYIKANEGIDNIRQKAVNADSKKPAEIDAKTLADEKFMSDFGESYLSHLTKAGVSMGKFKLDHKFNAKMTDTSRGTSFKYFACKQVNGEYLVIDVVPTDPNFEETLLQRISCYSLNKSFYTTKEAEAMEAAAKENGRVLNKKLTVYE